MKRIAAVLAVLTLGVASVPPSVQAQDFPRIVRCSGCERCGVTGYRGRIGLYELMIISDDIRHLITSGSDANVIRKQAQAEGMQTLREDALDKLRQGVTTPEEVVRVTRAI